MNKRVRSIPLPPLAFGEKRATIDRTPQAMQDRVAAMTNWVTRQDALKSDDPFEYRAVTASLEGLKLIAAASTPTTMKVDDPGSSVVIPLYGNLHTRLDCRNYTYGARQHACFNPKGYRDSEGGTKSCLIIGFEESRLHQTIAAMTGTETEFIKTNLDAASLLNLRAGSVEFDRVFSGLCQMVDRFEGQDMAMKSFGLADSFYRGLAMLFHQERFLKPEADRPGAKFDPVCRYIEDHLGEVITLTDLEVISGLSARALQYAFLKRFNLTPMQYVRQRKAHFARELLSRPNETTTVASVAAQCGFANFSKFSALYGAIFGERPSETLKKAS